MPSYEFLEKIHVYTTIEANSEEEAWKKLDEINFPQCQDPRVVYDPIECFINYVTEDQNAEF